jgi:hypothetical protein
MLPEGKLQRLTPESGVSLERTTTRVEMSCARLFRLLIEAIVLRRMHGAMSYKFRTRLDVNNELGINQ